MKTLTQVVLPIAVIAGLVFGITWIMNYSPTNTAGGSGTTTPTGEATKAPPLKFVHLIAKRDPKVLDLRDWEDNYEMSTEGHFDFWFRNANDKEVRVTAQPSCTCSGVDLIVIPEKAWNTYVEQMAIAGWPGMPASAVLAAAGLCELESRLQTHPLAAHGKALDAGTVPAASSGNPQLGIARVNFKAKNEPKAGSELNVTITSKLPDQTGAATPLKLYYNVVAPYEIMAQDNLGELRSGTVAERDIAILSRTRENLKITLVSADTGDQKDCVEWSEPVPLTAEEKKGFVTGPSKEEAIPINLKTALKIHLKIHERRDVVENGQKVQKQLDLGPLYMQLKSTSPGLPDHPIILRGMVRGDLTILTDREVDRIDFGASFRARDSRTKQVTLVSNRAGLDIELLKDQCTPEYLGITLQPQKDGAAGKKWTLTVVIPEEKLYGTLPTNSYVVLRTKDTPPRKIRIPVSASTYQ